MSFENAINDVRRFSKSMRGLIELADKLEGVSSIEQAVEESNKRLASAAAEESRMGLVITDLQEQLRVATKNLAVEIGKAQQQASEIIGQTKTEYAKVMASIEAVKQEAEEATKLALDARHAKVAELDIRIEQLNESIRIKEAAMVRLKAQFNEANKFLGE